jgi:hypothetical protein
MGRVIYVHDAATNTARETLGVYLVASDPDGMENLSAFYVINDDAQLFWKVGNGAWVTATAEGESWIGTSSLSMPGSRGVPPGEYRVVLQANGGATVEDTFTVPAREVSADAAKYPAASLENGILKVTGVSGPYEIWAYGKDGKFSGSFPSGAAPISASVLPEGSTYRVFAWHADAGYGVLSGSYKTGGP